MSVRDEGNLQTYGVHINGATRPGRGARVPLIDPSIGQPFADLAAGNEQDLDDAISAAVDAFHNSRWRSWEPLKRAEVLTRGAELIRGAAEELAVLETRNIGRPVTETRQNVLLSADDFTFYAALSTHLRGATVPMGPGMFDYTLREPLGVCGLVVPWNNPLDLFSRKVAPALAAGNAVVVKPASATPVTALRIAQLLEEAGLPTGMINIVPGPGATVGDRLVGDRRIAKISFTGATETGRRIMSVAAQNVLRVSLELGGKSPSLVFADADLEQAARGSVTAMFTHAGQTCTARSRLLIEASVYDEFLDRFVGHVKALRVGDPFDERTEIGPVISQSQLDSILGYVERATAAGAYAAAGGGAMPPDTSNGGYFVEPTVLTDVRDNMEVVCEEIFGPVIVVDSFRREDEALRRANDTQFGLAATIWTRDLARAHRLVGGLEAGTVTVNTTRVSHVYAPFGGYKESGLGRELGVEGIDEYLQTKNVVMAVPGLDGPEPPQSLDP